MPPIANELLTLAYYLGEDFANFVVALLENPSKFDPLACVERKVVATATGDCVVIFEVGEAGNKMASALWAIKVKT